MAKTEVITVNKVDDKKLLSDIYMDYKSSEISKDMSEEDIRNHVEKLYVKVNSQFDAHAFKGKNKNFDINGFLDGIMGGYSRYVNMPHKYNAETINKIMENPYRYKDEIVRVSLYLYIRMQEYKGILDYKSNMLTYSNVVDWSADKNSFSEKIYMKNLDFVGYYNIASKFQKATKILVRDDVYFAYEVSDESGHNFLWKTLPSEYCYILGRDRFGTYRVGFNFAYFDAYPKDLDSFPEEFRIKHSDYLSRKRQQGIKNNVITQLQDAGLWSVLELDNSKAIAFKFDDSVDYILPYFSGMFVDLVRLAELKDIDMVSTIADNYKLIHQLIPISPEGKEQDDYLISGDDAIVYHNNLRDNVPKGIGVATTPMKLEGVTLKNNVGSQAENIVTKHVSNLLTSSGTSSVMFNGASNSSVGLDKNIQVDENNLFKLLRQYELFMNKRLFLYNKNTWKCSLKFLDHTYYNTSTLFERYLKAGQFGMETTFEINAVMGRTQKDLISRLNVMDKLNMRDSMIPLKSTHVGDGLEKKAGDPKGEDELTEDGQKSRDRGLSKGGE